MLSHRQDHGCAQRKVFVAENKKVVPKREGQVNG
jgi:hypothetical protein